MRETRHEVRTSLLWHILWQHRFGQTTSFLMPIVSRIYSTFKPRSQTPIVLSLVFTLSDASFALFSHVLSRADVSKAYNATYHPVCGSQRSYSNSKAAQSLWPLEGHTRGGSTSLCPAFAAESVRKPRTWSPCFLQEESGFRRQRQLRSGGKSRRRAIGHWFAVSVA